MNDNTTQQIVEVKMPKLGEAVVEGTILRWFKQVGESISADEPLFEVSTDKVDTEVPSPAAGVVLEILANVDDIIEVGEVVARIGDSATATTSQTAAETTVTDATDDQPLQTVTDGVETDADSIAASVAATVAEPVTTAAEPTTVKPASAATKITSAEAATIVMSPLVRRLITTNNLDPRTIRATGLGGRITRADVEREIEAQKTVGQTMASADISSVQPERPVVSSSTPISAVPPVDIAQHHPDHQLVHPDAKELDPSPSGRGYQAVPLNKIRNLTAQHMVMSKQVSPHVLSAIEVDYEAVERARLPARAQWKAEEGFSLTYLPFIARAVIDALREYPYLNASFGDDELILHQYVNLAVAVDINFEGLLAPVIHRAEGKRLRQLAREIVDIASRARNRQLKPDDLSSGTFTITNAGRYGTLLQFPIINQPQVAILSTDGISRKPVVVTDDYGNESIAIHSVGVLSMAWDHRAFDGAYAAAFIHRVKEIIETRDWTQELC